MSEYSLLHLFSKELAYYLCSIWVGGISLPLVKDTLIMPCVLIIEYTHY